MYNIPPDYTHPLHRDVIGADGTRFRADSSADFRAALGACRGHDRGPAVGLPATIEVFQIARRADGSDGERSILRTEQVYS